MCKTKGSPSPGQDPRLSHLPQGVVAVGPSHHHWPRRLHHSFPRNSTPFRARLYSVSQRMLLTFIWCQILVFWNPHLCTLVSKVNCVPNTTFSNRAVVKLLSLISTWQVLDKASQSFLVGRMLIWPAISHLEVNISFGLSAQKLSKLPSETLILFWSVCAHTHMQLPRMMTNW